MTYKELYEDIVHLGFNLELESELDFNIIEAINRACRTVNALRPREAVLTILHTPLYPAYYFPDLVVLREDHTLQIAEDVQSMWFQAAGEGTVKVMLNGSVIAQRSWKCKSGFADISLVWSKGDSVVFFAESAACVRNVCLYNARYAENSVPWYASERSYDLSKLTNGAYNVIVGQPMLNDVPVAKYDLLGSVLRLAAEQSGVVSVRYRANVPYVTGNDPEETIPIDADLTPLIAPLAASWLYLEHDEDKALYYRQRYEEMAARVDRSYHRPGRIVDNLNWG